MKHIIKAVYERGVLKPLEPVRLDEGEVVELSVRTDDDSRFIREPTPEENRRVIEALLEIASLPDSEEDDGSGGDKHDEIIYGKQDDLP